MIRRLFDFAALLSLLAGVAAAAAWDADLRAGLRPAPVPSTWDVQAELVRPIGGLQFTGGRLGDLLGFARQWSAGPVEVDWDAIEAAGLRRETPAGFSGGGQEVGQAYAALAEALGLVYATRGGGVVITTRAALGAGKVPPPSVSLKACRAEWVWGPQRWTVTVHDGEVHVFRTPADPAAVFQPTAAAAARRQSSVNSASHRLGVKVGRLGYPDEVLRIDVALKSIGWAAAPLPALWFVVTLLRARQASRAGMCRHCGYDVRATPDRCPECGMPVARPGVPMTPQAPALV